MGRRPELKIDAAKIKQMYLTDKYTCADLASLFDCTDVSIRNHLVAQGVKLRPRGKWKFKYPKRPFSRNLIEEAYMVGFRIGDLHVYKERSSSRSIILRCHTTQLVQVRLCQEIFERYSTVVVSNLKNGSYQVACYLDLSFEFLMSKKKVPRKYLKNEEAAWAFIAGYADAEGNIILNQGRARFKIDCYDLFVLRWIHNFLIKQGINSKLRRIGIKGEVINGRSKIKWNSDLWRLNINSAESLRHFFKKLKPYLRHETRKKHAEIALINIKEREEKHAKY